MEFLNRSVLVVAHPDDENLWFSSILSKVEKIVVCFLPVATNPVWTEGRRKSLSEHLLSNVHCLELDEAGVFWGVNWDMAVNTEYGLKITKAHLSDKLYISNYEKLKTMLREHLQHYDNVFTHNPWGEYGHPEHVQVYRAVKALQDELKFTLWFSNYASNKSANLMIRTITEKQNTHSVTLETDKVLAQRIANIYKRNSCWTWFDDYEWCNNEAFIKDTEASTESRKYGTSLPINLLAIQPQHAWESHYYLPGVIVRVMRTIKRIYLMLLK